MTHWSNTVTVPGVGTTDPAPVPEPDAIVAALPAPPAASLVPEEPPELELLEPPLDAPELWL